MNCRHKNTGTQTIPRTVHKSPIYFFAFCKQIELITCDICSSAEVIQKSTRAMPSSNTIPFNVTWRVLQIWSFSFNHHYLSYPNPSFSKGQGIRQCKVISHFWGRGANTNILTWKNHSNQKRPNFIYLIKPSATIT